MGRLLWAILLVAGVARGSELRVDVVDQSGRPVADAVVSAQGLGVAAPGAPARAARTQVIDQVDLQFDPYIALFRPGDRVAFHNSDATRHHVYSFSESKSFEFVLAPGQQSSPLVLDNSGVVAVGCNIHDSMISYLFVSNAPFITTTDGKGKAVLAGLSPGSYTVRVWQPRLRPGTADPVQSVVIPDDGSPPQARFRLRLLPDTRHPIHLKHTRY